MNRKQVVILLVVGLIAGYFGIQVSKKNKESFKTSDVGEGQKLLPNFPINDVAHLRIKGATGEVNLVKKDDLWRVKERQDYPANFSELSDFMRKLADLKTIQDVKVGPSQMGRLELNAPDKGAGAGTLVEFKDAKDATLKSVMLGKKYTKGSGENSPMGGGDFPVGRYVMVNDGQNKVWLINESFSNIETKPEQWLSKDFFKVEKLKSIAVTHAGGTNSWKLEREKEGGDLKLADAKAEESLDTGKASGAGYALSSPSFNDVLGTDSKVEDNVTAKLETFDGFVYDVKLGKPAKEENYPLSVKVEGNFAKSREPSKDEKPEDKEKLDKEFKEKTSKLEEKLKAEKAYEKWTYLVAKWTVDPLLKERKDLLAEKKDEKKEDAPAAVPPPGVPDPLKEILPPK
jgi:hypothetical protein